VLALWVGYMRGAGVNYITRYHERMGNDNGLRLRASMGWALLGHI
jgi:hypothetical protein